MPLQRAAGDALLQQAQRMERTLAVTGEHERAAIALVSDVVVEGALHIAIRELVCGGYQCHILCPEKRPE